jgi:hypothetical protein
MSSFTMPETIVGVPLWVPAQYNYFQVEEDSMPNGDPALIVNGAVSDTYKAFMAAPTLSPHDIFNLSDTRITSPARAWSMSVWLKLDDTAADNEGRWMLGCSTRGTSAFPIQSADNANGILSFGPVGTAGFHVYRTALNNVASPVGSKLLYLRSTNAWRMYRDRWHLFTFTVEQIGTAGAFNTQAAIYLDNHPSAILTDSASGSAASGSFGSPRYLHIGGYGTSQVGRNEQWRMAKWAFHDHVLTAAERDAMWLEMYDPELPLSFSDDFNRASLGPNWVGISGSGTTLTSNELQCTGTGSLCHTPNIGSPNMWAELDVMNTPTSGTTCMPLLRVGQNAAASYYALGYHRGNNRWEISRTSTNIANSSSNLPTPPFRVRVEAETNGSNNVDLRVYEVVAGTPVLRLSFTDSSGSKLLDGRNAGVLMQVVSGTYRADNFACGGL